MFSRRRFLKGMLGAGFGLTAIPHLQAARRAQSSDHVFMMSYFQRDAEALHLAYSLDGYLWQALNNNLPVLSSTVGTLSMRDPFIRLDEEGVFRLLWTDGWESNQIGYSYSYNLVKWEEQRLIPLMVDVEFTRNCWAPEFFYDHEAEVYRLIWASTVREEAGRDHRIWSSVTNDFETFSPPEIFFDPGYTAIDATMVYDDRRYVMPFKDERANQDPSKEYKAIRITEATSATGPFDEISDLVTPQYTEGPTVFRLGDDWIMYCDRYQDKLYTASISSDLREWRDITDEVQFPPRLRHATVF
ncbi:MAG: glycoside hydrolase family 43 protein, partial [Anaerolineae bacterium]|nr:glycoside hydrolase family 43 protein [Anaerolineae bacterium]